MRFSSYLESITPDDIKVYYEGGQIREAKFKKFQDVIDTIASGDFPISLEMSGKKDGKKVFVRFSGKNLQAIIDQYNKYFDEPFDEEKSKLMLKTLFKEFSNMIEKENISINSQPKEEEVIEEEPKEEEEIEEPTNLEKEEEEIEEQPIQKMKKERRDTAEQQEF